MRIFLSPEAVRALKCVLFVSKFNTRTELQSSYCASVYRFDGTKPYHDRDANGKTETCMYHRFPLPLLVSFRYNGQSRIQLWGFDST